jgi:hypothetical protein
MVRGNRSAKGVYALLLEALSRERDGSFAPIRTHRARPKRGLQEIGRSRGGPSSTRAVTALSAGQTHELLSDITDAYVAADKAAPLVEMLLVEQRLHALKPHPPAPLPEGRGGAATPPQQLERCGR